ncbi:hypothetical protein E3N88_01969 [Mikania micrantha]|uniref:Wall-associated receptor kinase galacturonan-binding domain-containing protein n=1 Tax=Mikania micrantha TaxID=192012 RepID=A0A5N6Q305_9ASTR|nr:hypothetical protein E3N88_01969 [Mikania micrantha]
MTHNRVNKRLNPNTNCPASFSCPGLTPFKYPLFNVTDTRCGLIKINCTSKGGEIQLGGQSYEITGKLDTHNTWSDTLLIIHNTTLDQLVNNKSCEALMNDLIPESPHPLLYSISVGTFITLFKCTNNLFSSRQTDAYFHTPDYKRYNTCNHYIFYYNYLNGTVPSDLPRACQVVRLPAILPNNPGLDETNIFSVISYYPYILFNLSSTCDDCYKNGQRCYTKNGVVKCSDVIKGAPPRARRWAGAYRLVGKRWPTLFWCPGFERGQTVVRKRENGNERINPMKMGLLGSLRDLSRYATAHKDTVALRDKWRGKFERGTSSRYARGTLEPVALREETQFAESLFNQDVIITSQPSLSFPIPRHSNSSPTPANHHFHQLEAIVEEIEAQEH